MSPPKRQGISLIEVLVVLAIIAIGIGLLMPATRNVRVPATRSTCTNHLKQLMLGLHGYNDNGQLHTAAPTSSASDERTLGMFPRGCFGPGATPEERLSWMVAILPYIEQETLYRKIVSERGYSGNSEVTKQIVRIYNCPGAGPAPMGEAVTNYIAMAGICRDAARQPMKTEGNGFMGYDRLTTMGDILDGTSTTIALMETGTNVGPWARGGASTLRGFDPNDLPHTGKDRPFGIHPQGPLAGMADGHVESISRKIDPKVLAAAMTISGGESLDSSWSDAP